MILASSFQYLYEVHRELCLYTGNYSSTAVCSAAQVAHLRLISSTPVNINPLQHVRQEQRVGGGTVAERRVHRQTKR